MRIGIGWLWANTSQLVGYEPLDTPTAAQAQLQTQLHFFHPLAKQLPLWTLYNDKAPFQALLFLNRVLSTTIDSRFPLRIA